MHVSKGNKGHLKNARMLFLKAAAHSKPDMIPFLHLSNTSKKRRIGLYTNFMFKKIIIAGGQVTSLRHRPNLTLVKHVWEIEPNSLFLAATYVPGFEYAP